MKMESGIGTTWITTTEAAELTGYSPAYMRTLARRGRVTALKAGRDWLISRESLLAYRAQIDRLGAQKYNPWRDDLVITGQGRQNAAETLPGASASLLADNEDEEVVL